LDGRESEGWSPEIDLLHLGQPSLLQSLLGSLLRRMAPRERQ
jgi:hypothetical protein